MKKPLLAFASLLIGFSNLNAQGFQPVQITAGDNHSVVRCVTNTAKSFGDNSSGELGDGTFTDNSTPVQVALTDIYSVTAKGFQTIFLKTDGTVWGSGWNNFGQLGDGSDTIAQHLLKLLRLLTLLVSVQEFLTPYSLSEQGTVSSTGNNLAGQLGDGTNNDRNTPDAIPGLDSVVEVTGGTYHSLFLKDNGTVWAVGGNFSRGQLGDGTTDNRLSLIQIPRVDKYYCYCSR